MSDSSFVTLLPKRGGEVQFCFSSSICEMAISGSPGSLPSCFSEPFVGKCSMWLTGELNGLHLP